MKTIKIKSWVDLPENYTGIVEWANGTKEWYKDGLKHREDGPAVECSDGSKHWYKEGKLHREDGPAAEGDHNRWILEGKDIFCSCKLKKSILCFKNKVVLSKETHELYPKIQKWKILSADEIYEVLIFPGLEKYISE